ncbi:hypothetical protein G7K_4074-t1 [Saitoella complicata NRRL Y-17804]|uniref:Uncharacterized protein n=1 Tax=Saitoella complicata (strain BCRC 22490 / CBS 7301 / JCM 7358 / NBRC 10748 / NRRL Y-17804) TaxID=698492 RepID=A0A0E9NJG3_SAICN|nr:hypothetical protein G7K_4074-t1 [Saitoella complicata NRRL Y-17804]
MRGSVKATCSESTPNCDGHEMFNISVAAVNHSSSSRTPVAHLVRSPPLFTDTGQGYNGGALFYSGIHNRTKASLSRKNLPIAPTHTIIPSSIATTKLNSLHAVGSGGRTVDTVVGKLVLGTTVGLNAGDLAGEGLADLTSALEGTTSSLELLHGHGGLDGGLVDDRSLLDGLVNGDGGLDDLVLDGLALNDGLDNLLNVVVGVLSSDGTGIYLDALGREDGTLVVESSLLRLEGTGSLRSHLGLHTALSDGDDILDVNLSLDLTVSNGLDTLLVVLDVVLAVNGLSDLLTLGALDGLVDDGGLDLLANVGGVGGGVLLDGGHFVVVVVVVFVCLVDLMGSRRRAGMDSLYASCCQGSTRATSPAGHLSRFRGLRCAMTAVTSHHQLSDFTQFELQFNYTP